MWHDIVNKWMKWSLISLIGLKNLLTHLHIILFWSDTQYIFIYLMICLSLYIDTIHRNETAVSPKNLNKTRPVCKRVWTLCASLPAIVSLWVICVTTVREAWNTSVFIHSNVPSWKWKSPHIKHLTKNPYVIWLQADVLKSCDVWQVKYIMVIFVVTALGQAGTTDLCGIMVTEWDNTQFFWKVATCCMGNAS